MGTKNATWMTCQRAGCTGTLREVHGSHWGYDHTLGALRCETCCTRYKETRFTSLLVEYDAADYLLTGVPQREWPAHVRETYEHRLDAVGGAGVRSREHAALIALAEHFESDETKRDLTLLLQHAGSALRHMDGSALLARKLSEWMAQRIRQQAVAS